jgi:hypothetical protein
VITTGDDKYSIHCRKGFKPLDGIDEKGLPRAQQVQ